ncbi:hypothetical protein HDU76_010248, partial [Blyttiomyces sp. JEL0837]
MLVDFAESDSDSGGRTDDRSSGIQGQGAPAITVPSTEMINKTLENIPPAQLLDVMSQLK